MAVRTQQFGQRQSGALGLDVPQRDVERRHGLGCQTATADRSADPHQLVPKAADVVGVFAQQFRRQFAGMGVLAKAAGTKAEAESETAEARSCLDFREQQGEAGQRFLATGQNLGVADRSDRLENSAQPDP